MDSRFDDLDDESFAKLIEETLGDEFDPSMIDEFRNSDFFDEFVKSLDAPLLTSRRNSSNDSEQDKQDETETTQQQSCAEENTRIPPIENESTSNVTPAKASTSTGQGKGRERKKSPQRNHQVKTNAEPKTSKSTKEMHISSSYKENNNQGSKIHDPLKMKSPPSQKKKEKQNQARIQPKTISFSETPAKSPGVNEHQQQHLTRKQEKVTLSSLKSNQQCFLIVANLANIKSIFPTKIYSPVILTAKMLDQIRVIEAEIKQKGFRKLANPSSSFDQQDAGRPSALKKKEMQDSTTEVTKKKSVNWEVDKLSKILAINDKRDNKKQHSVPPEGKLKKLENKVKCEEQKMKEPKEGSTNLETVIDKREKEESKSGQLEHKMIKENTAKYNRKDNKEPSHAQEKSDKDTEKEVQKVVKTDEQKRDGSPKNSDKKAHTFAHVTTQIISDSDEGIGTASNERVEKSDIESKAPEVSKEKPFCTPTNENVEANSLKENLDGPENLNMQEDDKKLPESVHSIISSKEAEAGQVVCPNKLDDKNDTPIQDAGHPAITNQENDLFIAEETFARDSPQHIPILPDVDQDVGPGEVDKQIGRENPVTTANVLISEAKTTVNISQSSSPDVAVNITKTENLKNTAATSEPVINASLSANKCEAYENVYSGESMGESVIKKVDEQADSVNRKPLSGKKDFENVAQSQHPTTKIDDAFINVGKDSSRPEKVTTPESSSPSIGGLADDDLPHDTVADIAKSPSPDRIVAKKKNVIESSSDDGDARKDTCDDTDTTDHPKSSDEEAVRKTLPFERKKEYSRFGKFDKFEHERQRKLSDKKKGKEKPKESDALEDILKEKPLAGSFRIPKKSTPNRGRQEKKLVAVVTPLAASEVPKENLHFEKCRPGSDKKDKDNFESRGPKFDRVKKEPGPYFKHRQRLLDDSGDVLLGSTESDKPIFSKVEVEQEQPDPEPLWGDDGGDVRSGCATPSTKSSASNDIKYMPVAVVEEIKIPDVKIETEIKDDESEKTNADDDNPEVPVTDIQVNQLAIAMVTLMDGGIEIVQLPDVDTVNNLYEATIMKLAWWFVRCDVDNSNNNDGLSDSASDCSWLDDLSDIELDDESYHEIRKRKGAVAWTPADEFCGRALLTSEYRSGPGEKFVKIFQVRSGGSYDKENFQARCNLCNVLVVGRKQLASHILNEEHGMKMSSAGGVELDKTQEDVIKKQARDAKAKDGVKIERDGKAEPKDVVVDKVKGRRDDYDNHHGKKNVDSGKREDRRGEDRKSDRRKRSRSKEREKHRRSDGVEITRTSTGLPLKIPAGTFPDRNTGKKSRSRSRSPRQKRARSRSPRRRKSKSKSPQDKRRRSRTPVQRILRSPIKRSPSKERPPRRRSTSEERVQKFLEKTNIRRDRSRSPRNSHFRKRHKRSRSRSPGPVLPKRDNKEFHEKLALTMDGKWTDEMEQRWKLMEAEEAIFMEQFGEKSKALNAVPEKHPKYADEWTEFWERRFSEVEQEGRDPESYDYVPEWKEFWSKRLRELLDLEYETGSLEIKKKYGMDCDTLRGLRQPQQNLTPSSVSSTNQFIISNPASVVLPTPVPVPVVIPTPIPAPVSGGPLPVPAPAILTMAPTSTSVSGSLPVQGTMNSGSISSKSFGDGEDLTARSMSISDGGSVQSRKDETGAGRNSSKMGIQQAPITAGDVISHWEKLKSGGLPRSALTSSFGPAKSVKSLDERSNNGSGSIDSIDFSGFGLVQILHVMSKDLEDQLSFFYERVKDYYKMAEELDLKKRNKSLDLLQDEDFVVMLSKIRDRFMAMIRAGILSSDILRKLSAIVNSLNPLLEHPHSQKHRSKFAIAAAAFDTCKQEEVDPPAPAAPFKDIPFTRRSDQDTSVHPKGSSSGKKKKETIAEELTDFVLSQGKNDISDNELREMIHGILSKTHVRGQKHTSGNKDLPRDYPGARGTGANESWRAPRKPETSKTYSIESERNVGNAIHRFFPNNVPLFHMNSRKDDSEKSSTDSMSGRNSPFSRRNYSGNPAAQSLRDKELGRKTLQYDEAFRISSPHIPHTPDPHATGEPPEPCVEKPALMNKAPMRKLSLNHERKTIFPIHGKQKPCGDKEVAVVNLSSSGSAGDQQKGKPALPPGIMQLIIKERNDRAQARLDVKHVSDSGEDRSRQKKKIKRSRRHPNYRSESESTSDSELERQYRKVRKKYKKRKKKAKYEGRKRSVEKSKSSERSEISSRYFIRTAPPEDLYGREIQENQYHDRPRFPDTHVRETLTGHRQTRKPIFIPQPPLSVVSSQSSKTSVTIRVPSKQCLNICSSESDCENDQSLPNPPVQKSTWPNCPKVCDNNKCSQEEAKKVKSVSEMFWNSKVGDDDDKSLCSISSEEVSNTCENDGLNKPSTSKSISSVKIKRQLRQSIDAEKEPGEVSSSDSD